MSALSINVRYRPVRIGFCVKDGDMDGLRTAMRNCHALWGGRYNPIITIGDDAAARQRVSLFRADCLLPATIDEPTREFIKSYRYLSNPTHSDEVFFGDTGHRHPNYLDVLHPMRRLHREHFRSAIARDFTIDIHSWEATDPLADVMLAVFGGVPEPDITGVDYAKVMLEDLQATAVAITQTDPLPSWDRKKITLGAFCALNLREHYSTRHSRSGAGVFVGSATSFGDLVTFWNLRATGAQVVFYDPEQAVRMDVRRDAWIAVLDKNGDGTFQRERPSAWHDRANDIDKAWVPKGWVLHALDEHSWNGLNLSAPNMFFAEGRTLGSLDEASNGAPRLTFQLPDKGLEEERPSFRQNLVATIEPTIGLRANELWTLSTPDIPELNEYYGRNCYFEWNRARAEPTGLGVIVTAERSDLSLSALRVSDLFAQIFGAFGIAAEPSAPGLIANRLIQQMGDIQGCRVFKIAGVRTLIEDHKPDQTFRAGAATKTIFGEGTASPLDSYKLHIEARPPGKGLKATDVFSFLLRKRVFRAGLEFACPSCQLSFWASLDNARAHMTCEYCGDEFDVTPMLKDRDWAYRRSGLFGRNDHQEGAIPVVLTLQQLDTVTHSKLYSTAMKLTPSGAAIDACETDLVFYAGTSPRGKIQIAIGECKTREAITQADVDNLRKVAEAFPSDRFDVFIIFAKLAPFSAEEVALARGVNGKYQDRLILLTDKELEPYFVYERSEAALGSRVHAVSMEDLMQTTHRLYPEPDAAVERA